MKNNDFIKDPIHKEILIRHDVIRELINTKEFIRLSRICQLGLGPKLFPSATHTRYNHCLGAYEVASRFIETLEKNKSIKEVGSKDLLVVQIAALLHDIGHGPLSHVFEHISTMKHISHEEWGMRIIKDKNTEINKVLIKHKINPDEVISVINGTHRYKWMTQLISSDLDVDRIDYLMRDSYYIGTCYGTIDLDILLKRINIVNGKLCFSESCSNLIRSFWYGRIHMNADVYENKNLLVYQWILMLIFKRLRDIRIDVQNVSDKINHYDKYYWLITSQEIDVKKYLEMDDFSFFLFLDSIEENIKDSLLQSLINSFKNGDKFTYRIISKTDTPKLEYDGDKKYAYEILYINKKTIYSKKEKNHIWLFGVDNKEIKFVNSNLKKSIKNLNDITKIIMINENVVKIK